MADNLVSTTIRLNDAFSATLNKLASGVNKSQSVFGALKSSLSGNLFGGAEKSSGGFLGNLSTGVVVGNLVTGALGKIKDMAGEVAGGLDATTTSWKTFRGQHGIPRSIQQADHGHGKELARLRTEDHLFSERHG